jgi:LPXTG-site transpeptidase (sortase) family protein
MKRFLLTLFVPVFLVIVVNSQVLWSLLKTMLVTTVAKPNIELEEKKALAENSFAIPALGLNAPLVGSLVDPTDVSDWKLLAKDLTNGVTLAEKLALPGQSGNTVILGHSSELVPHRYSAIFAGLNELKVDDSINFNYKGQIYHYAVREKKIVRPTDPLFENLKKTDNPNQLVLITCWPVLSTAQRLVVFATPR